MKKAELARLHSKYCEESRMRPSEKLRQLLARPGIISMPCCFDALSARLIEQAGFELTFMSGFAVSATRLCQPDTGLLSYGEMVDQGRDICAAVNIPVVGDGDTGYGNPMNVKRTVKGYAQAGFACIMVEDQVNPKQCGHTVGKQVVCREEAFARIRAAVDARNEGADVLIMARTDARQTHDFNEALERVRAFERLGVDIVFMEAPESVEEMRNFCAAVSIPAMANMLEEGVTPLICPAELEAIGYKIVAYPLTLLSTSVRAMQEALVAFREGNHPTSILPFKELKDVVGFPEYRASEALYALEGKQRVESESRLSLKRMCSYDQLCDLVDEVETEIALQGGKREEENTNDGDAAGTAEKNTNDGDAAGTAEENTNDGDAAGTAEKNTNDGDAAVTAEENTLKGGSEGLLDGTDRPCETTDIAEEKRRS